MIDLIRASRTYDLATVYDFGGIYGAVTSAINNNQGYITAIERIETRIEEGIERIIDRHRELE
jgi:precorrin-6B methylase 2